MKRIKSYTPEIMGILIASAALNLWYLSSLAIENAVLPKSFDYLVNATISSVGAFLGAYFAFKLKKSEDDKATLNKNKSSLDMSLLIMARQINALCNFKRDLDPFTTPFERAFNLPALKPPAYSDLIQDIASLNHLIEHEEIQIILNISIEQERFEQAIDSINIRNNFYVNEIQIAISEKGLNGKAMTLDEYKNELGERLFAGAMNGSNTMYQHVNETISSLKSTFKDLRTIAKKIHPEQKFIQLKGFDTPPPPTI